MLKEATGVGTAGCDLLPSSACCVYCDEKTLALAPRTGDHAQLLEKIAPGTKMEIMIPLSKVWCEILVLEQINVGLWMVKRGDQHHLEEPSCFHLVHYRIRNVITSCSPFPARYSWQGAVWKTNWLSKNDIVCKAYSSWNPTLECSVVHGSIQVGLTGTKLVFADSCSLRSENPDAGLFALFTGFKVISESFPRAL